MDKALLFEMVLIAAVVLWCVFLLGKYYGRYKGKKVVLKKLEQYLHNLTPKEKAYLSPYVTGDENTLHYQADDAVSAGLVKKKIIYNIGEVEDLISSEAYNIQPWAKEYLVKNPHLLKSAAKIP